MITGLSILVVEDDHDVLASISEVLEEAGYVVTAARSGAEGLAALREISQPPAAMLVDFMMTGMSGAEFLRACRATPHLAEIPVVIISGVHRDDVEVSGNHGYLLKPFAGDQLLETIALVVSPAHLKR